MVMAKCNIAKSINRSLVALAKVMQIRRCDQSAIFAEDALGNEEGPP